MANRPGRIKSMISRNIADIVHTELKKSSIGLVSVNDVRVSDDYSYATVYVNFLPNTFPHQKIAELQKTEGFVRSSLAKKMDIYKVPKVRFVLDETSSSAARIDEALAKEEKDLSQLEEGKPESK